MTEAPAPGSPEWLKYMTASKIAAVVGTSPYESAFSLWHKMAGNVVEEHSPDKQKVFGYGHYLEPVLLQWFADQHPELTVKPGAWHECEGWAGASPDGTFWHEGLGAGGLVQAKTSRKRWEWEQGVPPGYYDQVQWEMWVTGDDVCYVVADIEMEFREFLVERDDERIHFLFDAAHDFMRSLRNGTPPPLDSSTQTYQTVRELHPDIDPVDYQVDPETGLGFLLAKAALEQAVKDEQHYKTLIADGMGNARRAVWNDHTLFTRQARNGGTPYLKVANTLPKIGATP